MAKYKDVVLIFIITCLYHTMNQMFVPTLPLYITGLGGSESVVGAIVGILSLGAIAAKVFSAGCPPALPIFWSSASGW